MLTNNHSGGPKPFTSTMICKKCGGKPTQGGGGGTQHPENTLKAPLLNPKIWKL